MNLLQLFKEIILAIKFKSLYVNRVFIPEISIMQLREIYTKGLYETDKESIEYWFTHYCGLKIKRLLKYTRDEKRFGWIIWYV